MGQTAYRTSTTFTFCVSGSINQFQAPVAVQTDTTIRITDKRKNKNMSMIFYSYQKQHFFFFPPNRGSYALISSPMSEGGKTSPWKVEMKICKQTVFNKKPNFFQVKAFQCFEETTLSKTTQLAKLGAGRLQLRVVPTIQYSASILLAPLCRKKPEELAPTVSVAQLSCIILPSNLNQHT